MKKCCLAQSFSILFTLLFITNSYAVEPPQIVEQAGDEFVDKEEYKVDLPAQNKLSTTAYDGSIQVDSIQFQGGSVFEFTLLAEKVKPLIGQRVSKEDIVKALSSVTEMYQQAGYVLSFAFLPKQDINQGRLTISLVEGYVIKSEVVTDNEDVRKRIERFVAKIQSEKPLTKATFERYVALIERTPGYTFKVNVPKPKTVNGATTIRIEEVKSKKYDLTVGLEDSKEDEPSVLVGATMQSMTSYADKLTASMLIPNGVTDTYYHINYQQEIGSEGLIWDVSANQFESHGDDRMLLASIPIDYEASKKRERFSVGLKYPILLSAKSSWWLGSKLHHLNEKNHYELTRTDGIGHSVGIDKNLRYSAIEVNTQWMKKTRQNILVASGKVKQGIEIGNNKNEFIDANGSRQGAESTHFNLMSFNGAWRHLISPQWRLQTKGNLFLSDDVLPSSEQVRYGGQYFGRGYSDSQAPGDRGYAAEVELRYIQTLPTIFVKRIEPYILVDAARSKLESTDKHYALSSVAVGADFSDAKHYTLGFEYAKPLGDAHFEAGDRSPIYNIRVRWNFN